MLTHVGNFCGIGLEPLFCHHRPLMNLGASNDERVRYRRAHQALLFADQSLEVLYLKYLSNKTQFICRGYCEDMLAVFQPLVGVRVHIATLNLIPDLAGRDQVARLNQVIQPGPDGFEYTGEKMLQLAEGTGVKDLNHAAAPWRIRCSRPAKFFALIPKNSDACSTLI